MKPTEDELVHLYKLLKEKSITVRVLEPERNRLNPVVDIWFTDEGKTVLKDIFSSLRPSTI